MYKVGDEVLVKGEVVEVMSAVPYPIKVKLGKDEDAYVFSKDEICFSDKIVKTYEMGLNDAWELARKLYCEHNDSERREILGIAQYETVLECMTPEEALAKIEVYEKEKSVCVGDVVIIDDDVNALVVDEISEESVFVLTENGCIETRTKKYLEKTDKKISIESLLRQIGE